MESLLFAPEQNTDNPSTRRVEQDATGVFQPCGRRACRVLAIDPSSFHIVDLRPDITDKAKRYRARAEQVLAPMRALAAAGKKIRFFALLCHGWRDGMQLMPGMCLVEFIALLAQIAHEDGITIALWACSTADPPDGVLVEGPGAANGCAYRIWRGLDEAGVKATVCAHSTKGHALFNPMCVCFSYLDNPADGIGDFYVRPPRAFGPRDAGDPLFPEFRGLMRHTTLCYEAPFLTPGAVYARVSMVARGAGVPKTGEVDPRRFSMFHLEAALALLDIDPGPVDGTRDDATEAAIKKFQRTNKDANGTQLDDDGLVGGKTAGGLLLALRARGLADARAFAAHVRAFAA